MQIPFLNPAAQYAAIKDELLPRVEKVLENGRYILGPELEELEREVAGLAGVRFGVGVNSGSDALTLSLRALEAGPGDEVITTPFTYIAPAEAIHQMGAKIVFADIDPHSFTLDLAEVSGRITSKTKAVIPVHLFGQTVPMEELLRLTDPLGIRVVEDCAQAIGATSRGRPAGGGGVMGCFSFYPTKNLGAAGDGGMIVTDDEGLMKRLKALRVHGIERRYFHDFHGFNSRLDELQAVVLRVKLKHLAGWNRRREEIAARYSGRLEGLPIELPRALEGNRHIYHVYAVLSDRRDALQAFMAEHGVPTLIYYPQPLHLQKVYADQGFERGDFPVAEAVSASILPLPMYPELTDEQVDYVAGVIRRFFEEGLGVGRG